MEADGSGDAVVLGGHSSWRVSHAAFSPDGDREWQSLAHDGVLRVWPVQLESEPIWSLSELDTKASDAVPSLARTALRIVTGHGTVQPGCGPPMEQSEALVCKHPEARSEATPNHS